MNARAFDLHTHSKASDGLLPAAIVVTRAQGILAGMALTDHDSLGGMEEALAAGRERDFPVIPGVELTTDYGQYEAHILAYFIDHRQPELLAKLHLVVEGRVERAREIVRKLAGLGFPLSWEEVQRQAPGVYFGRPHVVRALIARGLIQPDGVGAFFQAYLVSGAPAFVPHQELATREAITLAIAAGGVPVLAHPGRMGTDEVLAELVSAGLGGLEVNYPQHGPMEIAGYARLAEKFGLVATGGSDFHGEPGGVQLGRAVAGLDAVVALAERAPGPVGQAFLSALHIPKATRE